MKDWNPAAPTRSPCSRKHMYSPSEACQWFRGELGESVVVRWDQNLALWHQLNSPCLEEKECCLWPQEYHPHCQTWTWKHHALGCFLLREQDNCTASKGRWTGPCTVRARALKMGRGWVFQHDNDPHGQGNKGVAQEEAHEGPGVA